MIVVTLTLLVFHDVTLIVEFLLGHRRKHPSHPIAFEPKSQLEVIGRHGLKIVCAVEPGRSVERPTDTFDQLEVLILRDVLGPLKHHVLEEVSETGLAYDLVPGPDSVPNVSRDDRDASIGGKHDLQAIVEPVALEGDREKTQN